MSYFKLGAPSGWDKVTIQMLKTSTWNPFKYDDPKVDSLVSQIKSASVSKQPVLLKQLNTYIVDIGTNIAHFRDVRDKFVNTSAPPASTAIGVPQLARPGALFEVEAIVALPPK